MKKKFKQAVENLCDNGFTNFNELESQTAKELVALKIMETSTSDLPSRIFDINHDLIFMVAKWIDTNDHDLRDDIMEKLENLVTKAFYYQIEKEFDQWNKNNEFELSIARKDLKQLNYAYNRQRI